MKDKIIKDFKENNMSPYNLHIKHNTPIEEVYRILKENEKNK